MNLKPRSCLCAALLLLSSMFVATGRAQYVEDSVDCGATTVGSLCYNPRAGVVYGTSEYGPFFAISVDSNRIVSSTWFDYPVWVVYDSTDNKAYCIVRTADYDTIMVMDGTTHQRIGAIPLEWGTRAVWNPDNDRLYVTMDEMNKVAVIDCEADTIITEIPVGSGAVSAVLNRTHQKLYVQNWDSYDVSIIDLATNQVIKTIPAGNVPAVGCYSMVGDKYYGGGSHEILVLDGLTDSVVTSIPLLGYPGPMVEVPVHHLVVVATSDSLLSVDVDYDSVVARVPAGRVTQMLVWSANTDQVYASNSFDEVAAFTGDGRRVIARLSLGDFPFGLALAPEFGRLYVGNLNTQYVYVIRDTASGIQEQPSPGPPAAALVARPNPFSRSVAIVWNTLTTGGHVARVYAQDGRLVRQARTPAGEARWVWDGRNDSGAEVPPGVYFLEVAGIARAKIVKLK
jgi:YVTN family beta-propeller protein